MAESTYETLNYSHDEDNDCPFVLELEIDDEISFKPLPKKPLVPATTTATISTTPSSISSSVEEAPPTPSKRALQPLHENKLSSYLVKTPTSTPLKPKDQTLPRTVKTSTTKLVQDRENYENIIPVSSSVTPKATPKHIPISPRPTPKPTPKINPTPQATPHQKDVRPLMKSPSPPVIYEDIQQTTDCTSTPANIMPSNLQLKRSFLPEYEDIRPIECQNLISRRASFLDTRYDLSDHEEETLEEQDNLLQIKIDDLETRNSELIHEKEQLESRISELLASSRIGELSQADIQVKALTEQLEV